jgi:hypothetical protein
MWLKNLRNVSDHFKTLLDGDKTSAAQFVGGALDPDQSATLRSSIDCPSAANAQACPFKATI